MLEQLNDWAEMYNKKDKECYNALLERDLLKLKLEKIKKILPKECFNNNQCNYCPHNKLDIVTCKIVKELQERTVQN